MPEANGNDESASTNWWIPVLAGMALQALQTYQSELDRASAGPTGERTPGFVKRTRVQLVRNLRIAMPLLLGIAAWYVVSSAVLRLAEGQTYGWGDAFYNTWLTMTTVGAHTPPVTVGGEVLIGIDAFAGIIIFGIILWLVTFSMTPDISMTYTYDDAARQFELNLSPALRDAVSSAVRSAMSTSGQPPPDPGNGPVAAAPGPASSPGPAQPASEEPLPPR
jgi:hypothetical protein